MADPVAPARLARRLEIRVFGTMHASDGAGREIALKARKTRALLGLLALRAPRMVMRSEITELLWSRRDIQQARGSLRQALHELHQALGAGAPNLLQITRSHIGLRSPAVRSDAAALMDEEAGPDALDAYGSTLLGDLTGVDSAFDKLLEQETERLAIGARRLAERLFRWAAPGQAELDAAQRLLAIDPAHEAAWRALIRAHAMTGDRTGAAAAFERCKARLSARGLAPGPETLELIEAVRETRVAPAVVSAPGAARREHHRPRLRIGVLPLRSLDPDQDDGLRLGLAEEITAALSPFRWLSCVSSTSLDAIAGEPRGSSSAWKALDLDFLLEGTIQSAGGRHRIMARLLDMRAAEAVVWARRFDPEGNSLLAVQDEIAAITAAQIAPELLLRESEHATARRSADPTAHELMLRAVPAIWRLDAASFAKAGEMLDEVLRRDPGNAAAHAWFAHWHLFQVGQGWAEDPKAASVRASELAERAVMLDPGDARALALAGHVRSFLHRRPKEGLALHERALAINPNLALAWCLSGLSHVYLGRHDEAIRQLDQAQFLSPYDPHSFFFDMALTMPHMLRGSLEDAARHGERAIELNPSFSSSYKPYLATLGHLGRLEDAAPVRARLCLVEPGITVSAAVERSPLTASADRRCYAEGLRRAGLPDS